MCRVLVSFAFSLGGDGWVDFGEGGREVVHDVDNGGASVADGDVYKLNSSPISAKGGEQGEIFVGLLGVFLVKAEVPTEAHLYEDNGAVLPVKGIYVGGVGRLAFLVRRRCLGRLLPPLSCRGLPAGGPMPECIGEPSLLLHRESLLPPVEGGSSFLWTRRLFDSCVGAG